METKVVVTGLPIEKADIPMQLIAILVKRLGGEQLININNELPKISGFMMQVTEHGNYLIKVD
jgi:hypothetical protein